MGWKDILKKKEHPVVPPIESIQPVDSSGIPTDKVLFMRQQGLSNNQIVASLQREGFQSHQIFDAMNQADIKGGVNAMQINNPQEVPNPENPMAQLPPTDLNPGMDLSQNQDYQATAPLGAPNMGQNIPQQEMQQDMGQIPQQGMQQDMGQVPPQEMQQDMGQGIPPQGMPQNMGQGIPPQGIPTYMGENMPPLGQEPISEGLNEKIEEIAEAIIDEKWEDLIKNVQKIVEWKNSAETKLTQVEQEVTDLKSNFDNLHKAIVSKIGDYDKNILAVGTEIKAMEKVFQKVLPTFTDNVAQLSRITSNIKKNK